MTCSRQDLISERRRVTVNATKLLWGAALATLAVQARQRPVLFLHACPMGDAVLTVDSQ
jgi:hypothetical protein